MKNEVKKDSDTIKIKLNMTILLIVLVMLATVIFVAYIYCNKTIEENTNTQVVTENVSNDSNKLNK